MPRRQREKSNSKIYHVIVKGIDNQDIFYDDQDRNYFLNQILKLKKVFNYEVYSYCLMTNHVHIVIKNEEKMLSKIMQSLMIRYVYYFNTKYERTGSLVQNRFKSKCVENQRYFLEVCRYIHRNPEKAGMAKTEKYKWSSYKEYLGKEKIINKKVLLHYFDNDISQFIKYNTKLDAGDVESLYDYAEYEIINRLSDDELIKIIMKRFEICDINDFTSFFRNKSKIEIEACIKIIKNIKGICKNQVARVIRVSKRIVNDAWEK